VNLITSPQDLHVLSTSLLPQPHSFEGFSRLAYAHACVPPVLRYATGVGLCLDPVLAPLS